MVGFPKDRVLNKCIDVYSLFSLEEGLTYDWMEKQQFLGTDKKIVIVFDKEKHDIECFRKQRVFIAFHEPTRLDEDLNEPIRMEDGLNELEKKLNKSYFNFQCQKQANINAKLILNKLKELNNEKDYDINYEIVLCGHSLGGSIAAVTYLQLRTLKKCDNSNPSESLMNLHCNNANTMKETFEFEYLDNELKKYYRESEHDYYCVTHGALLFGNKINKDYYHCKKNGFTRGLYNYINEKDPVPKLLLSESITNFQQIKASAIGEFRILPTQDVGIEQFLRNNPILNFEEDMVHHKISAYKTPVHDDNTKLDIIKRTNKDLFTLNKPYSVAEKEEVFLGEGAYGLVLQGRCRSNSYVAIKKICFIEQNMEIKNLQQLNNIHVVKLRDSFPFKKEKSYLIFEFCDIGSLQKYVTICKSKYKENELHDLSVQLFDGLEALHKLKIIHRDIKPANMLVTHSKAGFCYKLADLGSSVNFKHKDQLLTVIGTELYMSPEIYEAYKKDHYREKINLKTDVFSMASVFLFCLFGKHPWTKEEFSKSCRDGGFHMFTDMLCISDDLKDMLKNMMKINMKDRYSASDLKNHRFIKNETNIKQSTCGMARMIATQKENLVRIISYVRDSWNLADISLDKIHQEFSLAFDDIDGNIEEVTPTHLIEDKRHYIEHYNQRLKSLKELLKLCEINDNEYTIKEQVGFVRAGMAICYYNVGNFHNAIIENKKALEMFRQLNGRSNILSALRVSDNIGSCFYELGYIPEAIYHHKNSLRMKLIYYELELTKNDALWESKNKLSKPYVNNTAIELNYEKVFGVTESLEEESYNIANILHSLSYLMQCYKGEGNTKCTRYI